MQIGLYDSVRYIPEVGALHPRRMDGALGLRLKPSTEERPMKSYHSSIEPLESRIAPASVILTDVNGDHIKFTSSSSAFVAGDITTVPVGDGHHDAFVVNLSNAAFFNSNLTVSVTKVPGGDGQTYVGITAGANNLGTVNIGGDLGLLTGGAGGASATAINSLTVNSIGRFPSVPPDVLVNSVINGSIKTLTVKGDVDGTYLTVNDNVGSISIGGSLIGGDVDNDGFIYVKGTVGKISVTHDVRGGQGANSGSIYAQGNIGAVTVGGSIYGGNGSYGGEIGGATNVTSFAVAGSIYGGHGADSGEIYAGYGGGTASIGKATVGGSLIGGTGVNSGQLGNGGGAAKLTLGNVVIAQNLIGGDGADSGGVYASGGSITKLAVKGSIIGGAGASAGSIVAGSGTPSGTVSIAGSVFGGAGAGSGEISVSAGLQSLVLGGSLVGGGGADSGSILCSAGQITTLLKINGDVRGSTGADSGYIVDTGGATPIIKGDIFAGSGTGSGTINT